MIISHTNPNHFKSLTHTVHNVNSQYNNIQLYFKHAHSHAQTNLGPQHITDYTINYHITPCSVSLQNQFTLKYAFVVPS